MRVCDEAICVNFSYKTTKIRRDVFRKNFRHHLTSQSLIPTARDELHRMLNEDELRDSILLVFANKQDLPNAMSAAEMTDKLGLHGLRHRQWYEELLTSHHITPLSWIVVSAFAHTTLHRVCHRSIFSPFLKPEMYL